MPFVPNLDTLPAPQRALWLELATTPDSFTLYGGTALALRLGHRASVDFDFFSNASFDPERLAEQIPYLRAAERIQLAPDTLTCRVDRGGPVLMSFFGGLKLGQVAAPEHTSDTLLRVASLLDLDGTKAAVVQKRAEVKDYLAIYAILQHGIDLPTMLTAGCIVYGRKFNPLITLKALSYFDDVPALSYFDDVPALPAEMRAQLAHAVETVDVTKLPALTPYAERPGDNWNEAMKPLPQTPELLAVAQRVVWFKPPGETLAEPLHFLAHVMTYGTVEDLRALDGVIGPNEFREALDNAPAGIFDARSWAYWNLKYHRSPAPPLPVRRGLEPVRPLP